MGDTLRTELVVEALNMAVWNRRPAHGVIRSFRSGRAVHEPSVKPAMPGCARLRALEMAALEVIGRLLVQEFLDHALGSQNQYTGNVGLALRSLRREGVNRFPNALARWYPGHAVGFLPPFGQVVCVRTNHLKGSPGRHILYPA
jgi:hypothetical protein